MKLIDLKPFRFICFSLFGLFPVLVSGQTARDSLYQQILNTGNTEMSCQLTYPTGSSAIRRDFGNNAGQLQQLDRFLYRALFDTLLVVKQVVLTGHCSIEGTYAANERLATQRANSFLDFLDKEYSLIEKYDFRVGAVAEDWDTLRRLIASSAYPWRDQALRIIDGVPIQNGREQRLIALQGGVPYRQMAAAFFPELRRVQISILYDVERTRAKQEAAARRDTLIISKRDTLVQIQVTRDTVVIVKETPAVIVPAPVAPPAWHPTEIYPVIAVKTNLYAWAGMTPEFQYRRFMPNLAVEGFFFDRWSAVLAGAYSNWEYADGQKWGASALSLEPRFWLDDSGAYRYLYIGAFGQMGDYDDRRHTANPHTAGDYWQTGISVGCYLPLYQGLGIELGLRGGYESRDEKTYSIEDGHNYLDSRATRTRWGVMGVNVSIGYRF